MSELIYAFSEDRGRYFRVLINDFDLAAGDYCVIESTHGGDLVLVEEIHGKACCGSNQESNFPKVIRKASKEDLDKFKLLKEKEKKAAVFCDERIKHRKLSMKLVKVRYFFDGKKAIFYYTADGRVDFRELVKDMAKEFKMRIEMRQIGVRDEAKMIGGLGVCGRDLCCFRFMKSFEPVTIQKAKKQQIAINPTKISGLCGRLMCCLAFEKESKGRLYTDDVKVGN